MSDDIPRKSAQIIQFPAGGRASLPPRRSSAVRPLDLVPARAAIANVVCGSGWYHEDAIRDAEPPRR